MTRFCAIPPRAEKREQCGRSTYKKSTAVDRFSWPVSAPFFWRFPRSGHLVSALTTLTYDFTQSGYSNGSADGVLTGSFTGDLEPNGFITDVSSVTIQFQFGTNNSKLFATKAVSFFSFDTASNELDSWPRPGGNFREAISASMRPRTIADARERELMWVHSP